MLHARRRTADRLLPRLAREREPVAPRRRGARRALHVHHARPAARLASDADGRARRPQPRRLRSVDRRRARRARRARCDARRQRLGRRVLASRRRVASGARRTARAQLVRDAVRRVPASAVRRSAGGGARRRDARRAARRAARSLRSRFAGRVRPADQAPDRRRGLRQLRAPVRVRRARPARHGEGDLLGPLGADPRGRQADDRRVRAPGAVRVGLRGPRLPARQRRSLCRRAERRPRRDDRRRVQLHAGGSA